MQVHSRGMSAFIERERVKTAIGYIRRHDAVIFAVVALVNLTIAELLGLSPEADIDDIEMALLGESRTPEKCPGATYAVYAKGVYGVAYQTFYERFERLRRTIAIIPQSTSIPLHSKARLDTLAGRFNGGALSSLVQAVDPEYYRNPTSILSTRTDLNPDFKDAAISDYLYNPLHAAQKNNLEIADINFYAILPDLISLEAQLGVDSNLYHSRARAVAKSMTAWAVSALLDLNKPSSSRQRKLLYKETLRSLKKELVGGLIEDGQLVIG